MSNSPPWESVHPALALSGGGSPDAGESEGVDPRPPRQNLPPFLTRATLISCSPSNRTPGIQRGQHMTTFPHKVRSPFHPNLVATAPPFLDPVPGL